MATLPSTVDVDAEDIADADFRQVVNPSNTIVLPSTDSKGEVIQHLSNTIPTNDYGLPLYFIRSDLLNWHEIHSYGRIQHDEVEAAAEILDYKEGYPTQKTGSPFWSQLKHETHEAYVLFQAFIELAEEEGIRLLDTLAHHENTPIEKLRELAQEYYWSSRARAYDLFIVAATAKKREARTRKTEDSHFNTAGAILETIINRINDEKDLIKKMDAADLFDLFEKMVKIQRLSLGLTGAQASTNNQLPMNPGSTVEVILRQLTQNSGLSSQASEGIQERLKMLMGDEATALTAQELVIRATTGNVVHRNQPLGPPDAESVDGNG